MNNKYNQIYEDEKTINLIDLCLSVLKKWKLMVAAAVLLAVIAAGLTYMKSSKDYKANQAITTEEALSNIELTEEEEKAFQIKLDKIEEYQENVQERDYYRENSVKVKLNPNGFYQGSAVYVISADSSTDVLKNIEFCKAAVFVEENFEELSEMLSEETDAALLKEVVFSAEEIYTTEAKLIFKVQHYNQDDCEKMLDYIKEKMEEISLNLKNEDLEANVQIDCISAQVQTISDTGLMKLSSDILNARNSAYEEKTKLLNGMSENEKALYDATDEKETDNVETTVMLEKPSIDLKLTVLAAFLGAFLVAGVYAVLYLFDGAVHTKEELESWTNIPVFGTDNSIEMLGTMIAGNACNFGAKKVYLTGTVDYLNLDIKKQLKEMFAVENIELVLGQSILADVKSLQDAMDCEYMIATEKCNVSQEKAIREEIMKASSCGIKILGIILEK